MIQTTIPKGVDSLKARLAGISSKGQRTAILLVNTAAINIQRKAKRAAPVDTGRLRNSISIKFDKGGFGASISANVHYAGYVEKGTTHTQMPPPAALAAWARRHKIGSPFLIARAILARGGLPPRPFLIPAWREESARLRSEMEKALRAVVKTKGSK